SPVKLSSDEGDLWNTKQGESNQTSQIAYGGKHLISEQRTWWKGRVWEGRGGVGNWSGPASFNIGLLGSIDWKAKWIGMDMPDTSAPAEKTPAISLDGLSWIWFPDAVAATQPATSQYSGSFAAGSRYFRKVIKIPEGNLASATLLLASDDRFELW